MNKELHRSKAGRAASPTEVIIEMPEVAGDLVVAWVTDVCNVPVKEVKIPDDWKSSAEQRAV